MNPSEIKQIKKILKEIEPGTVDLYIRDLNSNMRIAAHGYLRSQINMVSFEKSKVKAKLDLKLSRQKRALEKDILGIKPSIYKCFDLTKIDIVDIRLAVFFNYGIDLHSSRINIVKNHEGNLVDLYTVVLDELFLDKMDRKGCGIDHFYRKNIDKCLVARINLNKEVSVDLRFFVYSLNNLNRSAIIKLA